jgi:hypothetical protein
MFLAELDISSIMENVSLAQVVVIGMEIVVFKK